jgi:hypothetical protein
MSAIVRKWREFLLALRCRQLCRQLIVARAESETRLWQEIRRVA